MNIIENKMKEYLNQKIYYAEKNEILIDKIE